MCSFNFCQRKEVFHYCADILTPVRRHAVLSVRGAGAVRCSREQLNLGQLFYSKDEIAEAPYRDAIPARIPTYMQVGTEFDILDEFLPYAAMNLLF